MELPAAVAAQQKLPVEISPGLPGKEGKNGIEVDLDYAAENYDVVVIQRPLKQVIFDAISGLQAKGVVVVIEVDDDFTSLHKRNQAYKRTDPNNPNLELNRDLVGLACILADHVIVSTPRLAEVYGGHGRVSVIPNFVPEFLLEWRYPKFSRTCGWSGSITTHPQDLQVVGNGVAIAVEETRTQFVVIGYSNKVQKALRLRNPVPETGWLPVADYWKELGRLWVGIVPLEHSKFNQAKSNLKGLEYAATGVPFVASPLPEYLALYKAGAGMIAHNERDWLSSLIILLSDESMRKEKAAAGKQAVQDHYTLEKNWHLWPEAWERAVKTSAKKSARISI